MRVILLLVPVLFLFSCLGQATPLPVEVQQYPATWTPSITPTRTPRPPTATLVIQRTPGALPTRDPNLRILPNAPRNGIGVWAIVDAAAPPLSETRAARANVLVTDGALKLPRNNAFVMLTLADANGLPEQNQNSIYDGFILAAPTSATTGLRETIKPRVLLVSAAISDTTTLDTLAENFDGARLENFLRAADAPANAFLDEGAWRAQIEMLDKLSSNPNAVILVSTPFNPPSVDATIPVEQWLNYALASFMLGANGAHTFFDFEAARAPQGMDSPLYNLEMGTPLGAPFKQNNVYQRRFTNGLVLVNPGNEAYAFALARNYFDASGAAVDQVNMPPHTGMLLLNAE